jgi:signal transduction histidine kinase
MGPPRDLRGWLRAHPTMADTILAGAITAAATSDLATRSATPVPVADLVVMALATLSLSARRRFPVLVLGLIMSITIAFAASGQVLGSGLAVAYLIATYTVAAHRGLAYSLLAGTAAGVGYIVVDIVAMSGPVELGPVIGSSIIYVGAWWLGRSLRLRRAYLAELESRARRLERHRDADARAARVEERARIARELHDVIAHHVSVMTVQAGAAGRILDRDPDGVREALGTIENMGRTALGEMRRLVGVLRTEPRPAGLAGHDLAPQPRLSDVRRLVTQLGDTGLNVEVKCDGDPRDLPPGVDLAAFRLVQEALTNTLKHAGPQATASVRIHYGDRRLAIEVDDDGRGSVAGLLDNGERTPGHGLVGMRERVALYGGDLRAGPRVGGGFEVRARFPLEV